MSLLVVPGFLLGGLVAAGSASAGLFTWFHLQVFGSLTPYGVNVVYANWNTFQILEGHFGFEERIYRLWGLFIDRRFGIGRWAPLLLAVVPGSVLLAWGTVAHRMVMGLLLFQLMIAAFVATTMMGWWFPGRTMLTVLPLTIVPLTMLVDRAAVWGKAGLALLGVYTLVITAGLAQAGHAGEITLAVDPFDMRYPPFQSVASLFPLYTWWTAETWRLTIWRLAAGAGSVALTAWPEIAVVVRKLRKGRATADCPFASTKS